MKAQLTEKGFNKRIETLKAAIEEALRDVDNLHVKIQKGNTKTGVDCWTVSLMAVLDCCNCKHCRLNCYDLKADLIYPAVIADRAKNSAIHKVDPERYWKEIDAQVKENFVRNLRINVGGDLTDEDFAYVAALGRKNKNTMILFFTKNYKGINKFLENHKFPKNVRPIMSHWPGMKMVNPNNLPESHLLYDDGSTTAPDYGAYYCGGNCTECSFYAKGCWSLKKNQHVIFHVH